MSDLAISRVWAMPNADTFSVEPIHNFVWKYLSNAKVSVDPFARNKRWATYTNDLNPETCADSHKEAAEFLGDLLVKGIEADLIIFDPPYSLEQCARSYKNIGRHVTERDTQIFGRWSEHKRLCNQILGPDGVFLYFGWNTNGLGKNLGFEIREILLVAHGSAHNDTICMAERRVELPLFAEQVA